MKKDRLLKIARSLDRGLLSTHDFLRRMEKKHESLLIVLTFITLGVAILLVMLIGNDFLRFLR